MSFIPVHFICIYLQFIHIQKTNTEFYQEQETSGSTALPCQVLNCRKFVVKKGLIVLNAALLLRVLITFPGKQLDQH